MAEIMILYEDSRKFSYMDGIQAYGAGGVGLLTLEEGKTYRVAWDGESYTVTAYRHTRLGYDCIFLGNEALMKGESATPVEPFVIYYIPANGYSCTSTFDTSEDHTVGIYQVVVSGAVFPEKQLQFEYNSFAGCFGYDDNPASFSAAIGETYRVMWGDDGVFDVTVFDASAVFPGALGMGNGTPFGFDGNGEPFIIVFIDGGILFLSLVDQVPTARSVSVHKVSDGSGGADSEGISVLPLASYEFVPGTNGDGETIYATILPLALEAWRKYRVIWDGMETVLTACAIQVDGIDELYLGNPSILSSFDDTGEPFFIFTDHAAGVGFIATVQEGESHTVGIWQTKDVGIVLRNHTGAEMGYYGVEGINVDTTDGGTKLFVDADAVPDPVETTVELDFSGGAMEVTPADGQAFSKVAVPVPENLLPENIAEGVNIAGIIGALAAGGSKGIIATSGSSMKIPNVDSDWEIQHNLGVVPDIVVVLMVNAAYSSITSGRIVSVYGVSEKMYSTNRFPFGMAANLYANAYMKSAFYYIDGTEGYIHDANEMTVKIGNSSVKLQGNRPYMWFAIGGLT